MKTISNYFLLLAMVCFCISARVPGKEKESLNNSSNIQVLHGLNIQKDYGIIRLLDDSIGIGYANHGLAFIDNIDTMNFVYKDKSENISYVMTHFKIEGSASYYYLTMEGVHLNNLIKIALPCFVDVAVNRNKIPADFNNYTNMGKSNGSKGFSFTVDSHKNIDGVDSAHHYVTDNGGGFICRYHVLNLEKYPAYH